MYKKAFEPLHFRHGSWNFDLLPMGRWVDLKVYGAWRTEGEDLKDSDACLVWRGSVFGSSAPKIGCV
jgi:hypothetical protein